MMLELKMNVAGLRLRLRWPSMLASDERKVRVSLTVAVAPEFSPKESWVLYAVFGA